MMLQPITYRGRTVAAATPRRFFLSDELHDRPPGDPEMVFVCFMCCYARELLTGRLSGAYSEQDARRFAQAALIPEELLERDRLDIPHAAAALGLPTEELQDAHEHARRRSPHLAAG
jgi:hypothetical protein